ncbi:MAG: DUF1684 domain-containing protein [Chloroflexota bacterium]|nr:DUF1684 domain-containing protein [Chloroflexota bacterium]
MDVPGANDLELADWRRRVAQLYVEVRNLQKIYGPFSPTAAYDHWRATRDQLYREHPQSPIPAGQRADYMPRYFAHDPALRFELTVVPATAIDAPDVLSGEGARNDALGKGTTVPTSGNGTMGVRRIGWVDVPFPQGERRLGLYWLDGYAGGLFLSFRDATNGAETYGGGRYLLDAAKSADLGGDSAAGTVVLDFNFAYHPSCAFDPRWVCPLVPAENVLDIRVEAGERLTESAPEHLAP